MPRGQKKGFKHTEEAKRKIGDFWRGKPNVNLGKKFPNRKKPLPFTEEHRKKIGLARLGNTDGFKKGSIPWSKGKKGFIKYTEEIRKKLSEAHKGEKSHWWKGGITSLVQQIRHCFKYRQWRSDVFTRDDFTCIWCGKRGGDLIADHHPKLFSEIFHENKIKSFDEALSCEEFWNINNGRTLCKECDRKYSRKK